jgi:hypothetical protein
LPAYVRALIAHRCPELTEPDLASLNGPLASLLVEVIDALAGKIDELGLRVEAKEAAQPARRVSARPWTPSGPAHSE